MSQVSDLRLRVLAAVLRLPSPLIAPLGWGPRADGGQPLTPQLRMFLRLLRLNPSDITAGTVEAGRASFRGLCRVGAPRLAGVRARDLGGADGAPVPLRAYTPEQPARAPRPLVVWLHGGGFTIGDLDTHDAFCRRLSLDLDAVVVAVDYRLAPEHPFPAAIEDCAAAWRWACDNAAALGASAPARGLGGDSAGGNLAAVLCQQLPAALHPTLQILCFPRVDSNDRADRYPSMARCAEGFFLDLETIAWFHSQYAAEVALDEPRIAPIRAADLSGLPPALVVTAGLDPLCDEGRAYARRLQDAGVPAELLHLPAVIHSFTQLWGLLPCAEDATASMNARIRALLGAGR